MPCVSIIGAGPAGSIAAICLARAGWKVDLFEQHRFPRDKVCGECLSPLAITVLEELGHSRMIHALGGVVLRQVVLVDSAGHEVSLALPNTMRGISRAALDAALLDVARESGAMVHQPARVETLDILRRQLRARYLPDNTSCPNQWDYLVLSDGKAALAPHRPPPTRDLGIKAHFAGIHDEADAITLFSLRGHYCGLAPIEGGQWNLAMSVPTARVRGCQGDMDCLYQDLLSENRGLSRRMGAAKQISPWLVAPLPRFAVRTHWPDRVIPIGNAAAALEPIGGEGIGLAMRSAQLAARDLIASDGAKERFNARELAHAYQTLWKTRRLACRASALTLSHPLLARITVRVLGLNQLPGIIFLSLTGKRTCL